MRQPSFVARVSAQPASDSMTSPTNFFTDIPSELTDELVQTLLAKPGLRIARIVSRGHSSPAGFWFDQDMDEWVFLVR